MSIHYYTVIWLVIPVREEVRYEAKLNELWRKRDTHSPRGDPSRVYTLLRGEKCTGYVIRSTSTTRRKQDVMIWLVAVDEWNGRNGEWLCCSNRQISRQMRGKYSFDRADVHSGPRKRALICFRSLLATYCVPRSFLRDI